MIKILNEGQKEFEIYCSKCGCHFSYELDDIKTQVVIGTNKSAGEDRYLSIECPICHEQLKHPNKANGHVADWWTWLTNKAFELKDARTQNDELLNCDAARQYNMEDTE